MLTIFINGDGGTFEVALVFPLAPLLWCLQIEEFKVLIANLILWYIGNWYIISDESSGSVFNSMYKTITEFYTSLIYSRKFLLSYGARDFFPDEWWIKVFSDELAFFFFDPSYLQRIPHYFIMNISCWPKYLGCIRDIFWHIQNNQIYNLVYPCPYQYLLLILESMSLLDLV